MPTPAMAPINLVTMLICLGITVVCFYRLAAAAIALACTGDVLGVFGGCNDVAIQAATAEGPISQTKQVFEYVGGKATGLASGF